MHALVTDGLPSVFSTVEKYRKELRWDQECDKIDKRTQSKLNTRSVNRRVRNIKILDKAIENIDEQIEDGVDVGVDKIHHIVRTQDILIGRSGDIDDGETEISDELRSALSILTKMDISDIGNIGNYIVNKSGRKKLEKAKFVLSE